MTNLSNLTYLIDHTIILRRCFNDKKIFFSIGNVPDCVKLQNDPDSLEEWCVIKMLALNISVPRHVFYMKETKQPISISIEQLHYCKDLLSKKIEESSPP